MFPTRVRFTGLAGEFELAIIACPQLDCPCTEISFDLRNVGRSGQVLAHVDVPTWSEVAAPKRPAAVGEMVQELLEDFPESERVVLRQLFADKRTISQYLKTCSLPADAIDGKLVFFDKVIEGAGEFILDGPLRIRWRFEWQDRAFVVMDSYCVNPDCDCGEIHLHVYDGSAQSATNSEQPVKQMFSGTMSRDGKMTVDDVTRCDKTEATALLQAFKSRFPNAVNQLRWRDAIMKEIGRRSGRGGRLASPSVVKPIEPRLPAMITAPRAVGRNDPCPCGSGLKYKKCCGR